MKAYELHPQLCSLSRVRFISLKLMKMLKDKTILDPFCGTGTIPLAVQVAKPEKVICSDLNDYSAILRPQLRLFKNVEYHWGIDVFDAISKFNFDIIITDPPNPFNGVTAPYARQRQYYTTRKLFFKTLNAGIMNSGNIQAIIDFITYVREQNKPLVMHIYQDIYPHLHRLAKSWLSRTWALF